MKCFEESIWESNAPQVSVSVMPGHIEGIAITTGFINLLEMIREHFIKSFNGEEEIIIKPAQVRRVLKAMEAVCESARIGKANAFEE